MAAKILDGRVIRDKIAEELKAEISRWSLFRVYKKQARLSRTKSRDSRPKLVIVQVGNLAESNTYIHQKVLFGQKIGAIVDHQKFPENISEKNLFSIIHNLNSDLSVHGIIVQLPIPQHLDKDKIIDTINPTKDVDGQTSANIKLLFEGSSHYSSSQSEKNKLSYSSSQRREATDKNTILADSSAVPDISEERPEFISAGQLETSFQCCSSDISDSPKAKADIEGRPADINSKVSSRQVYTEQSRSARTITNDGYLPATTKGILTLLDYYKIPIAGKKVTVVGRSSLVGKPTALAFLNKDATVTICHSETGNLKLETRNADILVVAVGRANLITKEHVAKGQVVIDVGINIVNYSSSGDSEKNDLSYSSSESDEHRTSREASSVVSSRQARTITSTIVKPESEIPSRKLVGDVDFENVSKIVRAITPVPGGIGPMTVASLFQNLLEAYNRQV